MKTKWKTPTTFKLLGRTVTVKIIPDLAHEYEETGYWRDSKNLIGLQKPDDKHAKDVMEAAFWHEAVHAMFDSLGYDELSKDEKLVEQLAQCIYQIITTAE